MSAPSDTAVSKTEENGEMAVDESTATTAEDPCPVCLSSRVDESAIDGCAHTFCYSCITEWLKVSESCPLCKAPVTEVKTSTNGQPLIKKMSELKAEAEAARIMAQANEVPMTSEREAVNQQIHIRRAEVQKLIADKARSKKSKAINDLYKRATSKLTQLIALKDEMERLPRRDIIGDNRFRDVVYRQDLIWKQISRPSTAIRFNSAIAAADPEGLMTRLRPFLMRELKVVMEPRKKPTDQVLTVILNAIQNYEINNPHFEMVLLHTRLFQPGCIRNFVHLLYEFCASGLDMEAFDSNSSYSLDPAKGPSGRFIPSLLPASSRTSEPIYINGDEEEEGDDAIIIDRHRSDSSSSDGITNLYNHPACRIRTPQKRNQQSHRQPDRRTLQERLYSILPSFVDSFGPLGPMITRPNSHPIAIPAMRRIPKTPEVISLEDDSARRDEPRINAIPRSDLNSSMGDPSWLNVTGRPSTSRAYSRIPVEPIQPFSSTSHMFIPNFGLDSDSDRAERDGREANRMRDTKKEERRIEPSWKNENGKKESRRDKRKSVERHEKKQRIFMDHKLGSRKNELQYYYDKLNGREMSVKDLQKVASDLALFSTRVNKLAEECNKKLEEKMETNGNSSGSSQDPRAVIDLEAEGDDDIMVDEQSDQPGPSTAPDDSILIL